MANELQTILDNIKSDKNKNLLPKNLKQGIKCLGVTGNLTGVAGSFNDEYQRVEYIEGTGTQYINTGVNPNGSNSAAIVEFAFTKVVTKTEQWAFGQYHINNGWRCGLYISSDKSYFDTRFGFSYGPTTGSNYTTRRLAISLSSPITSPYPMTLFAQQEQGNVRYIDSGFVRIYRCIMYEKDVPVRDFIPCYRKSDKVAGLYDNVNGLFYTNDGTGEFIVGPEIPPYTKLEYIENSNENQYIDIGVRATSDVGIELDVQTTNTNSIGFCGSWSNGTGILFGQHNGYGNQGAGYYMAGNGTWTYSGVPFDDTVFHKFIYDPVNNEISVDGTSVNINKNTGNSLNICLFRAYNWGEKSTGVRISNCKIYANGSLIKNLIPVIRTSDKKVCMFDLVEEKYYTASEGEFIAGPKL